MTRSLEALRYSDDDLAVYIGDVRDVLPLLETASVDAVVTSPPYWQQRAYLPAGDPLEGLEIGREPTFDGWVANLVDLSEELARVLVPTGSLWLNLGDRRRAHGGPAAARDGQSRHSGPGYPAGVERKSLVLAPYRLAIALCEAGWILRDRIVWEKTNPLPESARDRFAVVDEVLFRFTRTRYDHFDLDAVRIPAKQSSIERSRRAQGRHPKLVGVGAASRRSDGSLRLESRAGATVDADANVFRYAGRGKQRDRVNPGNVWHIPTASREGASFDHFAIFPEELVVRPILSTVRPGGTVLDPFAGTGTVSAVAGRLGRRSIAIELDPRRLDDIIDRNLRRLDYSLLGLGDPDAADQDVDATLAL